MLLCILLYLMLIYLSTFRLMFFLISNSIPPYIKYKFVYVFNLNHRSDIMCILLYSISVLIVSHFRIFSTFLYYISLLFWVQHFLLRVYDRKRPSWSGDIKWPVSHRFLSPNLGLKLVEAAQSGSETVCKPYLAVLSPAWRSARRGW